MNHQKQGKNDFFPMKLVEQIATLCGSNIRKGINEDYNVYVSLWSIEASQKGKPVLLEGTGLTYEDACVDLIIQMMNEHITIKRYGNLKGGYLTSKVRKLIQASKFFDIYLHGKDAIYDDLNYTIIDKEVGDDL